MKLSEDLIDALFKRIKEVNDKDYDYAMVHSFSTKDNVVVLFEFVTPDKEDE